MSSHSPIFGVHLLLDYGGLIKVGDPVYVETAETDHTPEDNTADQTEVNKAALQEGPVQSWRSYRRSSLAVGRVI